ncbi:hypothetical protein PCE1_002677 [Barthelona sp. PCE]
MERKQSCTRSLHIMLLSLLCLLVCSKSVLSHVEREPATLITDYFPKGPYKNSYVHTNGEYIRVADDKLSASYDVTFLNQKVKLFLPWSNPSPCANMVCVPIDDEVIVFDLLSKNGYRNIEGVDVQTIYFRIAEWRSNTRMVFIETNTTFFNDSAWEDLSEIPEPTFLVDEYSIAIVFPAYANVTVDDGTFGLLSNTSRECLNNCDVSGISSPSCQNSGTVDSQLKVCICPAGYNGRECESTSDIYTSQYILPASNVFTTTIIPTSVSSIRVLASVPGIMVPDVVKHHMPIAFYFDSVPNTLYSDYLHGGVSEELVITSFAVDTKHCIKSRYVKGSFESQEVNMYCFMRSDTANSSSLDEYPHFGVNPYFFWTSDSITYALDSGSATLSPYMLDLDKNSNNFDSDMFGNCDFSSTPVYAGGSFTNIKVLPMFFEGNYEDILCINMRFQSAASDVRQKVNIFVYSYLYDDKKYRVAHQTGEEDESVPYYHNANAPNAFYCEEGMICYEEGLSAISYSGYGGVAAFGEEGSRWFGMYYKYLGALSVKKQFVTPINVNDSDGYYITETFDVYPVDRMYGVFQTSLSNHFGFVFSLDNFEHYPYFPDMDYLATGYTSSKTSAYMTPDTATGTANRVFSLSFNSKSTIFSVFSTAGKDIGMDVQPLPVLFNTTLEDNPPTDPTYFHMLQPDELVPGLECKAYRLNDSYKIEFGNFSYSSAVGVYPGVWSWDSLRQSNHVLEKEKSTFFVPSGDYTVCKVYTDIDISVFFTVVDLDTLFATDMYADATDVSFTVTNTEFRMLPSAISNVMLYPVEFYAEIDIDFEFFINLGGKITYRTFNFADGYDFTFNHFKNAIFPEYNVETIIGKIEPSGALAYQLNNKSTSFEDICFEGTLTGESCDCSASNGKEYGTWCENRYIDQEDEAEGGWYYHDEEYSFRPHVLKLDGDFLSSLQVDGITEKEMVISVYDLGVAIDEQFMSAHVQVSKGNPPISQMNGKEADALDTIVEQVNISQSIDNLMSGVTVHIPLDEGDIYVLTQFFKGFFIRFSMMPNALVPDTLNYFIDYTRGEHVVQCRIGTFFNESSGGCNVCPNGTMNLVVNATSCDSICDVGYGVISPLHCSICEPGSYSNTTHCIDVEPGFYADKWGATIDDVQACDVRTYANDSGSLSCTNCDEHFNCTAIDGGERCPAGYYSVADQYGCQPCDAGHECIENVNTPQLCVKPQVANATEGSPLCVDAPYGHFANESGLTFAHECPDNTYNNATGQESCDACPAGHECLNGAIDPAECAEGWYSTDGSACRTCTQGHGCPGNGTINPTECTEGWFSEGGGICEACTQGHECLGNGTINPVKCSEGWYSTDGSACVACTQGHECLGNGTINPVKCSEGWYSTDGSACVACTPGHECLGNGTINPAECNDGWVSPNGDACVSCEWFERWYDNKTACYLPCGGLCNTRQNCTTEEVCACKNGYKGADCSEFDCGTSYDDQRMSCVGPNMLSCIGRFSGDNCDQCIDGWSGDNCESPVCSNDCNSQGTCVSPGLCQCNEGWSGSACDKEMCPKCPAHSTCVLGSTSCVCDSGYEMSAGKCTKKEAEKTAKVTEINKLPSKPVSRISIDGNSVYLTSSGNIFTFFGERPTHVSSSDVQLPVANPDQLIIYTISDVLMAYDPETNTWTVFNVNSNGGAGPSMPDGAIGVLHNADSPVIYAIGGHIGAELSSNIVKLVTDGNVVSYAATDVLACGDECAIAELGDRFVFAHVKNNTVNTTLGFFNKETETYTEEILDESCIGLSLKLTADGVTIVCMGEADDDMVVKHSCSLSPFTCANSSYNRDPSISVDGGFIEINEDGSLDIVMAGASVSVRDAEIVKEDALNMKPPVESTEPITVFSHGDEAFVLAKTEPYVRKYIQEAQDFVGVSLTSDADLEAMLPCMASRFDYIDGVNKTRIFYFVRNCEFEYRVIDINWNTESISFVDVGVDLFPHTEIKNVVIASNETNAYLIGNHTDANSEETTYLFGFDGDTIEPTVVALNDSIDHESSSAVYNDEILLFKGTTARHVDIETGYVIEEVVTDVNLATTKRGSLRQIGSRFIGITQSTLNRNVLFSYDPISNDVVTLPTSTSYDVFEAGDVIGTSKIIDDKVFVLIKNGSSTITTEVELIDICGYSDKPCNLQTGVYEPPADVEKDSSYGGIILIVIFVSIFVFIAFYLDKNESKPEMDPSFSVYSTDTPGENLQMQPMASNQV